MGPLRERIGPSEVMVDIGFKSEGAVSIKEFSDPESIEISQEIEVFLEDVEDQEGQVVLSKQKADFMRVWDSIKDAHDTGNTVEGRGGAERSGVCIHAAIHRARPDAACVLHNHMRYVTWLSMVDGGRLMPINQNSLRYYGRIAYDDHYNGLAVVEHEGRRMVEAMGDHSILILANHGVLVTGRSVAQAFYDLYYLEVCCKEQFTLVSSGAELFFESLKRRLDIEEPDYRD